MSAQVRRIAILVTSLDAAAGRQLLLAMPSQLARDVRKAMASLTSLDPEEQRRVLAEFRNQAIASPSSGASTATTAATPPARTATGNEPAASHTFADFSSPSGKATDGTFEDDASYASAARAAEVEGARPWAQLDVAALTDLLRGERPLVIAVVLSQLQPRHAARLLEQFPREQHRSVIANLTSLGEIDPEAMQAIDEHLASRIADYHHRRDSQSESAGRMQELLAAASPDLRGHWQEIIADSHYQLAKRLGIAAAPKPTPAKAEPTTLSAARAAIESPSSNSNLIDMLANNVVTTADAHVQPLKPESSEDHRGDHEPVVLPFPTADHVLATHATSAQAASAQAASAQAASAQAASAQAGPPPAAKDSAPAITALDQILELPPRTIARVLAAADGEVVLLALAGASPGFMQRFTTMLGKQDARVLQARLRGLGAINLQDVDEAQRRLCELASYIISQLRARRPAASTARVAA